LSDNNEQTTTAAALHLIPIPPSRADSTVTV
jgi:hypothetical protein